MIDVYNEVAPNFKSAILHRDVVGPYEMEHDYGLIGGNIFHGELSLEQLFHMRPAPGFADYRTPVRGLYYASSATHAGGGVCGIPGMQAAKAAIADRAVRRAPVADVPVADAHVTAGGPDPLAVMLEARSVALVGASPRPGSLGARMIAEVAKSPAAPRTYLVNPRYEKIGTERGLSRPRGPARATGPGAARRARCRARGAGGRRGRSRRTFRSDLRLCL